MTNFLNIDHLTDESLNQVTKVFETLTTLENSDFSSMNLEQLEESMDKAKKALQDLRLIDLSGSKQTERRLRWSLLSVWTEAKEHKYMLHGFDPIAIITQEV